MPVPLRPVGGSVAFLDGTAQPGDLVTYKLERVGFDQYSHVMPSTKTAEVLDEDGTLEEVNLWPSAGGGRNILVILPNGTTFRVGIPPGDDMITLETLHLLYSEPEPGTNPSIAGELGAQTGNGGAALVSFIAAGLLAIWRTVLDKLRERITTQDYPTFAAAVAATSGKTLIVNSVVAVPTNQTVPSDITLRFENGGRIEPGTGITVTIDGPIEAGHQRIFGGLGTIAGSPLIEAAFPAWFGAAGDDMTVDTIAVQKAAQLHTIVRGDNQTHYLIDGQYQIHTTMDLHRAGRFREGGWEGATNFTGGYWIGVQVRTDTIFEDAIFVLHMQGVGSKKAHAFGFGYPDSSARLDGCGFRGCTFLLPDDLPAAPERPHIALVQSVDHFFVEDCIGEGIITLRDLDEDDPDTMLPLFRQITRMAGFALYDSHNSSIVQNNWHAMQLIAIYEFCDHMTYDLNHHTMCATIVDCDKRDRDFIGSNNTIENDEEDTVTETQHIQAMKKGDTDAAFEANGIDGFRLTDNSLCDVQRAYIANGKPDVYKLWKEGVLAQSQEPADYNFTVSRNVHWDDDVTRTWLSGFTAGSSWEDEITIDPDTGEEVITPSAHNGTMCGDNFYINTRFLDCAQSLGSGEFSAVALVREGINVQFGDAFLVDGSGSEGTGGYGVMAQSAFTVDGSPIGATEYSTLQITSFAGTIKNTRWDAFFVRSPELVWFAGLVAQGCGTDIGGGGREALIYYPEHRNANIGGRLYIDPAGETIAKGLQVRSMTFKTGTWRIDTSQFRILGHDDDLTLDDSVLGSESASSVNFLLRPQLTLPIWPPSLGNTSASPHWLEVNGGVIIRWVAAHGTQGYAQVQFMVPEHLVSDTLTVRCRIRSAASEATEIRTNRRNNRVGQDLGWDATDVLADTATVSTNWVDMTVATLTNMQAGEVVCLAFRPRAVGNASLVQNKSLLSVYIR